MSVLPSGTVSLLFSDIEGSTLLLGRLGSAYVEALDAQRQILRTAWVAHGGTELGTEGDSFYVVFRTAPEAVSAAVQAQRELDVYRWPGGERVRVRVGIHTGSPIIHDGAYVGMDVHRAARIAGSAHGGQVVVSAATAELVNASLPDGVRLSDLGSHRLKDIPSPEHLFELAGEGLPGGFPPLKTLGAASSLPVPPTPLVGRDGELAELTALLRAPGVRLVTLTGPGGSGKTRLSIGVARALVEAFPDGVYFVPLAEVSTPDLMWATIAEVLDTPPEGRVPPGFLCFVAHRAALFVLDNLEQLPGAEGVVAQLLEAAPQVVVIATTRSPLHVPGELERPVGPLAVPDGGNLATAASFGAVKLFVQRAQMVRPDFALTPDNAADVAAVCRRLDGLPLAIELAAARSKLLSPHALLARLDTALDIAASGRGPSRQRTLRDTIGWSYDLLTADQQVFFRRLAVFSGGADLDAITAVAIGGQAPDGATAFDLVVTLMDASLVTIRDSLDGEPRIGQLETVRAYALAQLSAASERDLVQERHAHHYLYLAERWGPALGGDQYIGARARFETEEDNFREALGWALPVERPAADDDRSQVGLRLCAALGRFWAALGHFHPDGQRWLGRAVERADGRDSVELARCCRHLSNFLSVRGKTDSAHEYATASAQMCRRIDDQAGLAESLSLLGGLHLDRGQSAAGRRSFQEALAIATDSGDLAGLHTTLQDLAILEDSEHRHEIAYELKTRAIATARELGDAYAVLLGQHNLACSLRMMGRAEEAAELMRAIIPDALRLNVPANLMYLAEDYAAILAELGRDGTAAKLLGAADQVHERSGVPRQDRQQAEIAEPLARARAGLSPTQWNKAYEAGRHMTLADALNEARATDSSR